MARGGSKFDVYLEGGQRRTVASAVAWPGWCRGGRDEAEALQALFAYGPRYARAIGPARLGFQAPTKPAALVVVERVAGNATTDMDAPAVAPSADARPVDEAELERLQSLLKACWRTLDKAARAAAGKELRKGPRGGGRDVEGILAHVRGAEAAYLSRLGGAFKPGQADDPGRESAALRRAVLKALAAGAHGELPARGPRGGLHWTPRYFVRRAAYHVLDHAWEIEDRVTVE